VSTSPTPTPTGTGCRVTYSVNDWGSGFTGTVAIANTGGTAWPSWTLGFAFPGSQKISQGWSATWTQSGAQVTATSLSYNGAVAAGGSTSIGFNGTYTGANTAPATFTVNGTTCSRG
jgi:cellulase/cellobiase CelA1